MSSRPSACSATTRSAWWVRAISALPFPVLYAVADLVAWLACHVFPHRPRVVQENLSKAFPELDKAGLRALTKRYYSSFAQVAVEIVKAATIAPQELCRRVRPLNIEVPRAVLASGTPVLLMTAHQCNWEWQLLALSLQLGYPHYVAYKPLVDPWAEREMFVIRTRCGARLLPAPQLMPDLLKCRDVVRAVSLAVDQEPPESERKHWTRFLNRDTAFYMGADRIARAAGYAVMFVAMRRTARGYYEIEFKPLAAGAERLPPGELTERYARAVEAQIRAAPADWPWSHKRWRRKQPLNENA